MSEIIEAVHDSDDSVGSNPEKSLAFPLFVSACTYQLRNISILEMEVIFVIRHHA